MLPERSKTLVLAGVNFEVDSAQLSGSSAAVLDRVAASMRDVPEARIKIEGHTDSSGSAAHNLDLSSRRADSVMNYLARAGIEPRRLSAEGFGEGRPVATNETEGPFWGPSVLETALGPSHGLRPRRSLRPLRRLHAARMRRCRTPDRAAVVADEPDFRQLRPDPGGAGPHRVADPALVASVALALMTVPS